MGVRERDCEDDVKFGDWREPVRGGISDWVGCSNRSFFSAKFCRRREGMPAFRLKVWAVWDWRIGGRGEVVGRMRRMSQLVVVSLV